MRLPLSARQTHRHNAAAQIRPSQQIQHRRPHARRVHHHRAPPRQRRPPRHFAYPLHHSRIRRPQPQPFQKPHPIPPRPPSFERSKIRLNEQSLLPLHHRQSRRIPPLPQIDPQEYRPTRPTNSRNSPRFLNSQIANSHPPPLKSLQNRDTPRRSRPAETRPLRDSRTRTDTPADTNPRPRSPAPPPAPAPKSARTP